MLILVVEDDLSVSRFLIKGLREEGHQVDLCVDAQSAQEQAFALPYELILLDWMLPDQDGLSLLREWRARGLTCAIVMLTARDGDQAMILGLDAGADDYISKPFRFEVLLARIRALNRRMADFSQQSNLNTTIEINQAKLDLRTRVLSRDQEQFELSNKEFLLLDYLLKHRGEVVSRTKILDHVWQLSYDPTTNVVDVYIRYLRAKIDGDASNPQDSSIETIRGQGYRLKK
jgi:DNA-binding response OmpR family regulator